MNQLLSEVKKVKIDSIPFVWFPKFYVAGLDKSNSPNIAISKYPCENFFCFPAFVKDDKEIDGFYVAENLVKTDETLSDEGEVLETTIDVARKLPLSLVEGGRCMDYWHWCALVFYAGMENPSILDFGDNTPGAIDFMGVKSLAGEVEQFIEDVEWTSGNRSASWVYPSAVNTSIRKSIDCGNINPYKVRLVGELAGSDVNRSLRYPCILPVNDLTATNQKEEFAGFDIVSQIPWTGNGQKLAGSFGTGGLVRLGMKYDNTKGQTAAIRVYKDGDFS